MKVVINACFGGFGLSQEAFQWLMENKGWTATTYTEAGDYADKTCKLVENTEHLSMLGKYSMTHDRTDAETRCDQDIIDCIEAMGERANGNCADLEIVEIPDGVEWTIEEYDGNEHIAETHRTWR